MPGSRDAAPYAPRRHRLARSHRRRPSAPRSLLHSARSNLLPGEWLRNQCNGWVGPYCTTAPESAGFGESDSRRHCFVSIRRLSQKDPDDYRGTTNPFIRCDTHNHTDCGQPRGSLPLGFTPTFRLSRFQWRSQLPSTAAASPVRPSRISANAAGRRVGRSLQPPKSVGGLARRTAAAHAW